jgi:hypothetical protein
MPAHVPRAKANPSTVVAAGPGTQPWLVILAVTGVDQFGTAWPDAGAHSLMPGCGHGRMSRCESRCQICVGLPEQVPQLSAAFHAGASKDITQVGLNGLERQPCAFVLASSTPCTIACSVWVNINVIWVYQPA